MPAEDETKPLPGADEADKATKGVQEAEKAEQAADGAEKAETPPEPAAGPQDGEYVASYGEDSVAKAAEPAVSPDQLRELADGLKAHVDAGLADLKEQFASEINELAKHFEGKLDSLDVDKLESLVANAEAAVEQIKGSGLDDLTKRLTSLEARAKHFL